jgi:hypothetical protein
MVYYRRICVLPGYLSQSVVTRKISRRKQDFEIHHVIDDDLRIWNTIGSCTGGIIYRAPTVKFGAALSQLLVQPTRGLNLAANRLAKELTALIAVAFVGFLRCQSSQSLASVPENLRLTPSTPAETGS